MENLFLTVADLLKSDERFFTAEGKLIRNALYEAAMKMDASLIKVLLENEDTRKQFFNEVEIDGKTTYVFDKVEFGWFVNNKEFLPDSYTRYKNKIGLIDNRLNYITNSGEVELAFPYKDDILVGGQSKDEQKRNEVFYNKVLAPNEVDRLLAPKAFCKVEKYEKDSIKAAERFDGENLLIKGNNLLTISSLLPKYNNKIKCIYIDVPYNTGNDSFGYNDKFNHSSWLTFMANRLKIAHKLLKKEGTIAISVDNYEIGYLLVLLDEIFGKENRKNIITVRRASASGAKVINPGVVNVVEYVVIYSKDTLFWKPNRIYAAKGYDNRYNSFIINKGEDYHNWEFTTVLEAMADSLGEKKSKLKKLFGADYDAAIERFVIDNVDNVCRFAALDDNAISQEALRQKQISLANPNEIYYMDRVDQKPYYFKNGQVILFAKDRVIEVDGKKTFSQPATDIWDDVLPNDLHNEGGVDFKKGKKPEKLIARIIELCTNENDIVLDFFAGSGTTGAVALKMHRKFILCEQMDYIESTTKSRLINVINGEGRGVSGVASWQGGGSFVYCELAQLNQKFVDELQEADTDEKVKDILTRLLKTGFISDRVVPKLIDVNAPDFNALTLDEKKDFVMQVIDANMLYVNYSDIDDEEFSVSEEDKAFTRSFYGEN